MLQILAEALLLAAGQRLEQRPSKGHPVPQDATRGTERPGPYTPPSRIIG